MGQNKIKNSRKLPWIVRKRDIPGKKEEFCFEKIAQIELFNSLNSEITWVKSRHISLYSLQQQFIVSKMTIFKNN